VLLRALAHITTLLLRATFYASLAHSDPTPPGTPAAPECLPAAQKPTPAETLPNIAKNSVGCRTAVQPALGFGKSDTGDGRLRIVDKNGLRRHAGYPWLSPYRKKGPLDHFFFAPNLKPVFPPLLNCMCLKGEAGSRSPDENCSSQKPSAH